MLQKLMKIIIGAVVIFVVLLLLSLGLCYLIFGSYSALSFILFIVGALPIVFFSSGLFSKTSSGAIHTPKVIYRLVNTLKREKHHERDNESDSGTFFSSLSFVLAGVLLWIASLFV